MKWLNGCQQMLSRVILGLCIIGMTLGCTEKKDETLLPVQDYPQYTDFDKLSIGSGFNVIVRQGTTRSLRITVAASDQNKLSVTQAGGLLTIVIRDKETKTSGTVDITMPSLTAIDFSGGVEATLTGFTPTTFAAILSSGSVVTPTGSVQALTLKASGGSVFNSYNFPAIDVVVNLTGGSEARVAASKTLAVTASGGSQVFYKGTPTITQNLTGGSTVTKE